MGGCASKVPDETTSTQRKEPSTKGSANGSLRTAGTATTMPGPDDSIDRRKMLAGARTKLQMELSSMSGVILDQAQRMRARAIFEKLCEADNTLSLAKVPQYLHLLFGNAWTDATEKEKDQAQELFKSALKPGEKTLTFLEVLKVIMRQVDADFLSKVKREFARFDMDGDGYATQADIENFLRSKGIDVDAKNVQSFLQRFDANKDGKIDLDEFVDNIMTSPVVLAVGVPLTSAIERAFIEVGEDYALQDVRRELIEEFDMFSDHARRMKVEDAERVLQAQGIALTPEQMRDMLSKAGVDASKGLTQDDWLYVAIEAFLLTDGGIRGDSAFREAKRAFSIFDLNDDGFIRIEELEKVLMKEMSAENSHRDTRREEISSLVQSMDRNKDNKISLAEFVLFCVTKNSMERAHTVDERMGL